VLLKASQDFVLFSLKWATCHPAVTEAAHKVIVDNRQVWIDHAKTLQQKKRYSEEPSTDGPASSAKEIGKRNIRKGSGDS
jgi:hypothetical protein